MYGRFDARVVPPATRGKLRQNGGRKQASKTLQVDTFSTRLDPDTSGGLLNKQEQASETFLDTFGAQSRKRSACAVFSSELVENTGRRACFLGPPFCCNLPLVSGPDGVLKGGDIVCFACFLRPPF